MNEEAKMSKEEKYLIDLLGVIKYKELKDTVKKYCEKVNSQYFPNEVDGNFENNPEEVMKNIYKGAKKCSNELCR